MAEIVVFNHIPKTAGSSIRHVLFRAVGRLEFATTIGRHPEDVAAVRERLQGPRPPGGVILHTGYGVHRCLPPRHTYRQFSFLRDPIERTISSYFYARGRGAIDPGMSLTEFLVEEPLRAANAQTAFLGGLHLRYHLEDSVLRPASFDQALLDRAKAALEDHEAIGFTEAFDASVARLRQVFGWPVWRTFYRSVNAGTAKRAVSPEERMRVAQVNDLDLELYAWAKAQFPLPAPSPAFVRANRLFARMHPVARKLRR